MFTTINAAPATATGRKIYCRIDSQFRVVGEGGPLSRIPVGVEIVWGTLRAVGREIRREPGRVLVQFLRGPAVWIAESDTDSYDSPSP